jgi:hypothetical protein
MQQKCWSRLMSYAGSKMYVRNCLATRYGCIAPKYSGFCPTVSETLNVRSTPQVVRLILLEFKLPLDQNGPI